MRFGFIIKNGLCIAELTKSDACSGPGVNINGWSQRSTRYWGVSDVVTGKHMPCLEGATAFACNFVLCWATLGTGLPDIWFIKRSSKSKFYVKCLCWQLTRKLKKNGQSETNPRADVAVNLQLVVGVSFVFKWNECMWGTWLFLWL